MKLGIIRAKLEIGSFKQQGYTEDFRKVPHVLIQKYKSYAILKNTAYASYVYYNVNYYWHYLMNRIWNPPVAITELHTVVCIDWKKSDNIKTKIVFTTQ